MTRDEVGPSTEPAESIDAGTLAALEDQLGHDVLNQMIERYLDEAEAAIRRMEQAVDDDHVVDLTCAAHRLKGGSMTLGFVGLGALCASLEDGADASTVTERQQAVQSLREARADLRLWQRRRLPITDSSSVN